MRLIAMVLLLVIVLALAGCGAEDTVKSTVDPVAQAAEKSAKASSAAVTMDGVLEGGGQRVPLSGNGEFDFKRRKGTLSLTTSVPGQEPLLIDEVLDGRVVYMKSKAFARGLPKGKSWLKVDLAAAARKEGLDLSVLEQRGAGSDPTQFLKFLDEAGVKARRLGRDDVDGTPATKYDAPIDLARVARNSDDPALRRSVEQLRKVTGASRIPAQVWVDYQQRVVRERISYKVTRPVALSTRLTIEFSDYGKPVTVDVPPASETADLLELRTG